MMQPEPGSVVLGGHAPGPFLGSLVLGGHNQHLGRLFDKFNAEARLVGSSGYRYVQISDHLGLTRQRKAEPYADIKIKFFCRLYEEPEHWHFGGYLLHNGLLFGSNAHYSPTNCPKLIRPIVLRALLEVKL